MEGIKELLQIPLIIHPFSESSDAGDRLYGSPKETTCYGEGKMKTITDKTGSEAVSELTLYVDGSDTLTSDDRVEYYDKIYHIKALSEIRELDGSLALWVVYV